MQFLSVVLPLALAGSAIANPLIARDDACLAAVTGAAALGDSSLRSAHCSSFFKTIVTPAAITTTTTITGSSSSGWAKRAVTVCPNEVPNYASACNTAGYASACNAFGITGSTTITIAPTTTTKTVYVAPGAGTCTGGPVTTVTVTVGAGATVTLAGSTVTQFLNVTSPATTVVSTDTVTATAPTVTVTGTSVSAASCFTDSQAKYFVDSFVDLLSYTSYNGTQGPPGRGYHYNVSAAILATDFTDYSDSINWMANLALGSATFSSKAAFDYGQGVLQPELTMTVLNYWWGCEGGKKTVSWRWNAITASGASVNGVNVMELTTDGSKIQTNYAEFDNGAWLYSFGLACKVPSGSKRSLHATY